MTNPNKVKRETLADSYLEEAEYAQALANDYDRLGNQEETKKYRKIAKRCFDYSRRLRSIS